MFSLNLLESILILLLAICCYLLLKLHRANRILRWGYISMSDWCACKLEEVTESARMMARDDFHRNGEDASEKEIEARVYTNITLAKSEWEKEIDGQMLRLKENGVAHLDARDKEVILLGWFK